MPAPSVLEAQALDRNLTPSESVLLALTVVLPWYREVGIAAPLGTLLLIVLAGLVGLGRKGLTHRREAQQLRQQMLERESLATPSSSATTPNWKRRWPRQSGPTGPRALFWPV
jgi:hypothetical protein